MSRVPIVTANPLEYTYNGRRRSVWRWKECAAPSTGQRFWAWVNERSGITGPHSMQRENHAKALEQLKEMLFRPRSRAGRW